MCRFNVFPFRPPQLSNSELVFTSQFPKTHRAARAEAAAPQAPLRRRCLSPPPWSRAGGGSARRRAPNLWPCSLSLRENNDRYCGINQSNLKVLLALTQPCQQSPIVVRQNGPPRHPPHRHHHRRDVICPSPGYQRILRMNQGQKGIPRI